MDTNKELYNHILFEFTYKSQNLFLTETRGYVYGIDDAINALLEMVSSQIETTIKTQKPITFTYTEENLKTEINTFFNEFELTLTTQFEHRKSYLGEFNPKSYIEKDKQIICVPKLSIKISANNVNDLRYLFTFACGHELTHGYNNLQYAKQYGISEMATTLYTLNRMERNAYIAQLRQELLGVKDKINSMKDAFEFVKKSASYSKFLYLEKNINLILTIKDKDVQDNLIYATNSIMDTHFSTYNQLVKYFNRRWEKWKKNYLIKTSKIAYDVFAENNVTLDGKNMNNDISLRIK